MSDSRSYQVVESSYLRSVAVKCALIFTGGLLATAAVFYLMMSQSIGPTYGEGFRMLAQLEQDIFYKSLVIYGSTVLVALVCIIAMTVLYSHRVAGPIYRLSLFARKVNDGDLSSGVTLRQKDVIHPLALEMNQMVDTFHRTVTDINREIEELEKKTAAFDDEAKLAEKDVNEIGKSVEKISSLTSQSTL